MTHLEDWNDAVIVALGSNLAGAYTSREALLDAAINRLTSDVGPTRARSSWWANPAQPAGSGPDFLNGVVILETVLEPRRLLERLHAIERDFGRKRSVSNAPRTLDLDLIAHGRRTDPVGPPILPHPRAAERLFVMAPLSEIAPEWTHPSSHLSAIYLASRTDFGTDLARARRVLNDDEALLD